MGVTLEDSRDMLLQLLPRGLAFSREPGSNIGKVFTGYAEEFVRFFERLEKLIEESDPRSTEELIDEWESDWGLPTECTGPLPSLAERRQALVDRVVNIPDQTPQTYIDRAAQLGFAITITEYAAGDTIPDRGDIDPADAGFVVQINATLGSTHERVHGDNFGEPYGWTGSDLLECALRQIALAHHILLFTYS